VPLVGLAFLVFVIALGVSVWRRGRAVDPTGEALIGEGQA
jgi:hypothetical protein